MSILNGQNADASDAVRVLMKSFYVAAISAPTRKFYCDVLAFAYGLTTSLYIDIPGSQIQLRDITADWAAADEISGVALLGSYVYALYIDTGTSTQRVYRYDKTNLAAGGTLMTMSGQTFGTTGANVQMVVDPTGVFYFSSKAGNSASQHIISKYTLSGTTLTYSADTTCGATSANFDHFVWVDGSVNYFGHNDTDDLIRKYNVSGTLQSTSLSTYASNSVMVLQNTTVAVLQPVYVGNSTGYTQIYLP